MQVEIGDVMCSVCEAEHGSEGRGSGSKGCSGGNGNETTSTQADGQGGDRAREGGQGGAKEGGQCVHDACVPHAQVWGRGGGGEQAGEVCNAWQGRHAQQRQGGLQGEGGEVGQGGGGLLHLARQESVRGGG